MKKNIFAVIGSASKNSANLKLVKHLAGLAAEDFNLMIYDRLTELPHFNPECSVENTPPEVLDFRAQVLAADGLIICTPEYVFSIPSGLKNALEWCVSSTVFSAKPTGLITASANGEKGHEELQLIMKTLEADFTKDTLLLVQGVKGKFDLEGNLIDPVTAQQLSAFAEALKNLVAETAKAGQSSLGL